MGKKLMSWKTKGMNQDLSVSAFNPEFAFENMNLRLSTNEGNTLMSWVNEKGTAIIEFTGSDGKPALIKGTPLGIAVINHKLILFTHEEKNTINNDRIYIIEKNSNNYSATEAYLGNLYFDLQHPLETLVSFEAVNIEKVYWTDGKNQPRMAIISNLNKTPINNLEITADIDTRFDFVTTEDLNSAITVTKRLGGGTFNAGIILYCYTYFNKYAQQSNIINVSPIYYLTHFDRGAKPGDSVSNSFEITITNPDKNFQYIRLYSIQRTSLNDVPYVLKLEDLPIPTEGSLTTVSYVDTGSNGSTMDPTELLFVGGKEITALTMTDKDNTLFLGNIKPINSDISKIQQYFTDARNGKEGTNKIDVQFYNTKLIEIILSGIYSYISNNYYLITDLYDISALDNVYIVRKDGEEILLKQASHGGRESYIFPALNMDEETFESNFVDSTTDRVKVKIYSNRNGKSLNLLNPTGNLYSNTFTLNDSRNNITTFKGGDWYRFGFQLLKYTGEWSDPIFIDDYQNNKYPITNINSTEVGLVWAKAYIDISPFINSTLYQCTNGFINTYKRIRPVIVYPSLQDRITLCLGVLNPTVFNVDDRKEGIPYAQASWFFRPFSTNPVAFYETVERNEEVILIDVPENTEDYTAVNVIMVRMTTDLFYKTLKKGVIEINGDDVPFIGALIYYRHLEAADNIILDGLVSGNLNTDVYQEKHIFIIDSEYSGSLNNDRSTYEGLLEDTPVAYNGNKTFYLHKSIVPDDNRILHLDNFNLNLSNQQFVFSFSLEDVSSTESVLRTWSGTYTATFKKDNIGSSVAFKHYDSLYSDETEVPGDHKKQVEIQGSVIKYYTPFSEEMSENKYTNSEFFIDLSIVTLNSPDLDFDTVIQTYPTENLKLRIIGAVPITASASYHRITTTNAQLPIGYLTEEDENGRILESTTFGAGELDTNSLWVNKSLEAGKRLVSNYLWEDAWVDIEGGKVKSTWGKKVKYLVYPWQASRSLTNDSRSNTEAVSVLKTKIESNIFYSYNSAYFTTHNPLKYSEGSNLGTEIEQYSFNNIDTKVHLQENEFIENLQLSKQLNNSELKVNYYPNIDKALVNSKYFKVYDNTYHLSSDVPGTVLMKYKSGTHAVISLSNNANSLSILPYAYNYTGNDSHIGKYIKIDSQIEGNTTFWGDTIESFTQDGLDITNLYSDTNNIPYDFLWLGELYKEVDESTLFGGTGEAAIKSNNWMPAGEAKAISENSNMVELVWTEGDTYYQRYDCLKTYPFTIEDPNQLVEILSFMCETHVNLDGRYDRNRGLKDNTNILPTNFNLINDVYSQLDNFFSYKKYLNKVNEYPNLVTFTKTKTAGADIDLWTNITLASNLDLDGDKGEITSLQRFNDQLIAFQDTGISLILYNENVQIASTAGVPIEIANSGKVQGKRYLSNSIGCSNKWSIANTPSGIYFIDSNDKGIYIFNGLLNNLSNKFGFNSWCKNNIKTRKEWNPYSFEDFVTYYDKSNQEVLFINKNKALAFSEKLALFTSFYSYENTPYFCNLDDEGIWISKKRINNNSYYYLWKHNKGEYNKFFEKTEPYSMTLVGNPEPQLDKTFTNLEFRACVESDGQEDDNKFNFILPFDSIETWNEYQHGQLSLELKDGKSASLHHEPRNNTSSLKRKFRIWRCDIPRDNYNAPESNNELGISRYKAHPMDRMRNPWIYIKLLKNEPTNKTEIHDLVMTYFD